MSVSVTPLGLVRVGGGAVFLAQGAASRGVAWALDGPGTLTPLADRSNESGCACARYEPAPGTAGATVTVTARFYA